LQMPLDNMHVLSCPNQLNGVGRPAVLERERSFLCKAAHPVVLNPSTTTWDCWAGHAPASSLDGYVLALPLVCDPTVEAVSALLIETQQPDTTPQRLYNVWHKYITWGHNSGVLLFEVPGGEKACSIFHDTELSRDSARAPEGIIDTVDVATSNLLLVASMMAPLLLLQGRRRLMDAAVATGLADPNLAYVTTEWMLLAFAADSRLACRACLDGILPKFNTKFWEHLAELMP
jgi:hypothetical protein